MIFSELVGNEAIKKLLIQTVEQNRLSHSYLFIGIEGIRKISFCKRMG